MIDEEAEELGKKLAVLALSAVKPGVVFPDELLLEFGRKLGCTELHLYLSFEHEFKKIIKEMR